MRNRIHFFAILVAALLATAGVARADVIFGETITFDLGEQLNSGDDFSMSIYDNTYAVFAGGAFTDFLNASGEPHSTIGALLNWNDEDYGSQGVAYVDLQGFPEGQATFVGSISISAVGTGNKVRLNSFDFAAFTNIAPNPILEAYIFDEHDNYIWHVNKGTTVPAGTVLTMDDQFSSPLPSSSYATLTIQWRSPWDIGIDNIDYSIVPEPATLLTWGLGLAGLGFVAYRRRRRVR